MIEYQIMSDCGDRRLGVDANGNLANLTTTDDSDPRNTWLLNLALSSGGAPLAASIINKLTGTRLQVPNQGSDNRVELGPIGDWDEWSTWTFLPSDMSWTGVRPLGDSDLNLNVKGGCDSTELCVWKWSGGAPNEIWSFVKNDIRVADSHYRIYSKCGGFLALDSVGNLSLMTDPSVQSTPRAVWLAEMDLDDFAVPGCVLANASAFDPTTNNSPLCLTFIGTDAEVIVSAAAESHFERPQSWDFAAVNQWVETSSGWPVQTVAVRPTHDTDQNLNVKGGCGNTDIITWRWGGGADNELWYFERVSS